MTAVVGILCKNGIVIGSDSSATFGQGKQLRTIEQPTQKLCIIQDHILLAGTGAVGLDQRFCEIVNDAWNKNVFKNPAVQIGKILSRAMIEDMGQTYLKPGRYGALVGFASGGTPQLCEFDLTEFQPELKDKKLWYCSIGSTQYLTDPFLALMREVYWGQSPPNLQDGLFATLWALKHAITLNVGGVNEPIQIGILESKKGKYQARQIDNEEFEEVNQHIEETKEKMKSVLRSFVEPKPDEVEDIPRRAD